MLKVSVIAMIQAWLCRVGDTASFNSVMSALQIKKRPGEKKMSLSAPHLSLTPHDQLWFSLWCCDGLIPAALSE